MFATNTEFNRLSFAIYRNEIHTTITTKVIDKNTA